MATVGNSVRARLGAWPYEPDITQIVLLDHHMVPTVSDVTQWVDEADVRQSRASQPSTGQPHIIRTGALFPEAADAFITRGFETIDTLVLLEAQIESRFGRTRTFLPRRSSRDRPSMQTKRPTQRMRPADLREIAALDRAAFGDPWGNDEASLREVIAATPRNRARVVRTDGQIEGFAISGQSGELGYLQRLAVQSASRRAGIANALVADAMKWMAHRGATTVMVNTAIDNDAALALYEDAGFTRRPETLSILELASH